MCDGYVEAWSESRPKARKDHKCHECGDVIPKGTHYLYATYIWEGEPHTYKCCDRCVAVKKHMEEHITNLNKNVKQPWQKMDMCISIGGIQDELADGGWFDFPLVDDAEHLETRKDWIEHYEKVYMKKGIAA